MYILYPIHQLQMISPCSQSTLCRVPLSLHSRIVAMKEWQTRCRFECEPTIKLIPYLSYSVQRWHAVRFFQDQRCMLIHCQSQEYTLMSLHIFRDAPLDIQGGIKYFTALFYTFLYINLGVNWLFLNAPKMMRPLGE